MEVRLVIVSVLVAFVPVIAVAQTLDDAVNDQLEILSIECERLLGADDPNVVLVGELLNICTRGFPGSGPGPSTVTGGGAGTPAASPDVLEERLRKKPQRGFFLTGKYGPLDRDVTTFEDGYQSSVGRLVLGFDFAIGDSWVAGFALDGARQDGDFSSGGNFRITEYDVVGFGSYRHRDKFFVDAYASYGASANERQRLASFEELDADGNLAFETRGRPLADFDADRLTAGFLFAYDYFYENISVGPRVGLDYGRIQYDTYSEFEKVDSGLALTFDDPGFTSALSAVGVEGSVTISPKFGVLVIQQSIIWRHEFDNDQRDIVVSFVEDLRAKPFQYQNDAPDRDFMELDLGFNFVLSDKLQVFVDFFLLTGHDFFNSYNFSAGFRKAF